MKQLISIITLPLRMLRGCSYTVKEYVLLEIQLQKIKPDKDETLEDLDTRVWLQAFEDQHILKTTKNYLEHCYAKSKS